MQEPPHMCAAKVEDELFAKGLRIRKEVLGAEAIGRRVATANEYTRGFEEISTKAAWGLIWSRPGLTRRMRSLLNLGILTALGQPHELRLHIRAALRNGLTRKEISEALLHCSVYCGIPRAAEARRAMIEVFEELDVKAPKRRRR
jgi:4-carboxymuconolactone decarboxylase